MTAPTPTGNSCSLEDCYTNIFALTDINGIKWRKLTVDPAHTHIDPFEDPVLNTYAKCLQADILCVWRRMVKHSEQRPTEVSYGKELWIFWYGDPPVVLEDLLPPDLKEKEYGSWDKDSVLSYECRTLLFKALHNLIERCLLTKNFIRLGKWFTQPQDPSSPELSSHLSFCFNFFLHGESTVCASIEVKQHPAVSLLNAHHIAHAQETHLPVILAPYGLSGTLTGQTYRDSDQTTRKHLEEWKQFYPVSLEEGRENDINQLPNLVEVIVAGVRMKYPSCYILLVDPAPMTPQHTAHEDALHHPGIVADLGMKMMHHPSLYNQRPPEPVSELTAHTNKVYCSQLAERISQDNCITAGLSKRPAENASEETIAGTWEYSDPSSRNNCNCLRLRTPKNKAASGSQGKGTGSGKKAEKGLERQQSRILRSTPFHRRNQINEDFLHFDVDMFMPQVATTNTGCVPPSGTTTQGGVGNSQGSQVVMNNSGEVVTSMDSPASNAPSPLVEPYNQQVDSAHNSDPTMPTLSPHPPSKTGEKDTSAKSQTTTESLTVNSALVNGVATDNVFTKPHLQVTTKAENVTSPYSWNQQTLENTKANINSWLRSQQKQVEHRGLKRPSLPSVHNDSEELVTDSLYNFDSVYNWCDYPLKKVKLENKLELLNGVQDIRGNSNSWQNHKPLKASTPQPPAPDPYEFSDDSSINPASISRNSIRNSRDEMYHRPAFNKGEDEKMDSSRQNGDAFGFRDDKNTLGDLASLTSPPTTPGTQPVSGSLTREVDLIPQVSDLDNLFESDSDSNDDAFTQQSPAGAKPSEDMKATKTANTSSGPTDVIGSIAPSELSRMYPTPPSHENNAVLSPMTSVEATTETTAIEGTSFTIKTESLVGTLTEELSKDSMCVYKPPSQAQFVSSMKYAPVELVNSPLPQTHVPEYKPSWHFSVPIMEKHHIVTSQYINLPSIENLPSMSSRMPSSAIEASPATMFQNSVGQQRTPMSYELQSPASNASSYLNKTPNSNINLNHGTNNQIPEVHSLLVNIVLSDSILNLFKDHNFDSCSICVCNMNIKGADLGLYIPNPTGEQQFKCTCGFSAIMNKRYGHNAGLFYEDEVDITGIRDNRFDHRKPSLAIIDHKVEGDNVQVTHVEDVTQAVLQLLLGQFSVPYSSCSSTSLHNKLVIRATAYPNNIVNVVQLQDGNEVTYFALDQGRQAMEHCHPNKLEDSMMKSTCLHKWTYIQGVTQIPQNSLESVRLLKSLQPLLQDAIQNKRVTRLWEHTYKLQGPLTWKEFHQLAGRGTDENSEPQPIPSFLVGYDKDAITVSPYALKYWDKDLLEPYGRPRDIAYVIVTPENDYVMDHIKTFFKELSNVYEWSRLGRHQPVSDKIRDGMLRIGKAMAQKLADTEVDSWFKQIGDSPLAAKLRLYAQACRHNLGPFLSQITLDKSMFGGANHTQRPSHHKPPDINNPNTDNLNTSGEDKDGSQENNSHKDSHDDVDDSYECPAIVVYIVNPFSYAAQDWDDLNRLAIIGLLRCYKEVISMLPENMKNNIYLQIVPLQTIIDVRESGSQYQDLKNLAFSVFTSCRWNLTNNIMGRSLTGFGPAAAAELLLKRSESREVISQRLYSPAFVLAPIKDKQEQLVESCSDKRENSSILLCVYCLSEDQRWLLACCTDERGEMVETCAINIEIPNRNRRKKTSARKIGLGKLWEFLLGVISMSVQPTRLVIGRFGRIGHGELKGWSGLLSKKNIQKSSKHMREKCTQCSYQVNGEFPCILSACLTSLEQQPSFSVMPDCVKPEERQGNNCPLQTPRDASCSHILVFPTSATAQANSHQIQLDSTGGMDLGNNHLAFDVDLSDLNIKDDFENNTDDFGSLMDVFVSMTENSPPVSPRHASNPGSPGLMDVGRNSPTKINGMSTTTASSSTMPDPQDDSPNLLQQPLAMGYYISTAQTGPLPRWFWSACPENDMSAVKFFKAALHIHCSSNQDDLLHQAQINRNSHPLDSSLTCDVLRFVLEKYSSLSWLTFDPAKNDRQSCLPIHMHVLMQMYHAMNAYV